MNKLTIIYNINTIIRIINEKKELINIIYLLKINKKTIFLSKKAKNENIKILYIKEIDDKKLIYLKKYNSVICKLNNDKYENNTIIDKQNKILILDRIQDPYNLAACIRTAEAYSIDLIIINYKNSSKISNLITQISNGANLFVKILFDKNIYEIIKNLKSKNIKIIGLSAKSKEYIDEKILVPPFAIIMGSEKNGLSSQIKNTCTHLFKIKMYSKSKSINVSVSTGIILSKIKY